MVASLTRYAASLVFAALVLWAMPAWTQETQFTLDQYGNLTAQPQAIVATPGCFSPNTLGLLGMTKPWDCRGFGELQPAPDCVEDPRRVGCFGARNCHGDVEHGSVSCVVAYNSSLLAVMYIGIKNVAFLKVSDAKNAIIALTKLANSTFSIGMRKIALTEIKIISAKQAADMKIMVDPPNFHITTAFLWAPVYVPTTEGGPDAPIVAVSGILGAVQAAWLTKALAAEARYAAFIEEAVDALEKANASKINCLNLRTSPPVAIPAGYDPPEALAEWWAIQADLSLANARYEGEAAKAAWAKVTFLGQATFDMKPITAKMAGMTYTDLPQLVCNATACWSATTPTYDAVRAAPLQNCQ